jgi:hypothetical protein
MVDEKKLIKKYNTVEALQELQKKLASAGLAFGSDISRARRDIYVQADYIINNGIKCDVCDNILPFDELSHNIGGYDNICEGCIDNYYTNCTSCGDYINRESDVQYFDDEPYCDKCFFDVKDKAISEADISNALLIKLAAYLKERGQSISYEDLKAVDFGIRGFDFSIEACNCGSWYKLGSWGANSWFYLTSIEGDLLKAVDYLLQEGKEILQYVKIGGKKIE